MWTDLGAWFSSPAGARVLQTAIVPAVAILVAGVLAALIGRAATRAVIARADREQAAAAIAALVEAARAATAGDGADGRRRLARLRSEADVRTRLLPLPGAALAADWAAARTDAILTGAEARDVTTVRDRLIEWTRRPGRARRIFVEPATSARATATQKAPAATAAETAPPAAVIDQPAAVDRTAFQRPAVAATAAEPTVPAWQRTRAAEKLREERAARQQPDDAAAPAVAAPTPTAPARPHAHRADVPPQTAKDEQAAAPEAEASEPEQATPDWLDTYDDDAHVTRNLDLRTPPPVAATSVRDRKPTGSDIVPRS